MPFASGENPAPFNRTTGEMYEDALDSYVEALDMVMDNPLTRLLRMRQTTARRLPSDRCRVPSSQSPPTSTATGGSGSG